MAIQSLVIILTVLIALLVIGVPISYAIGISSLAAILQIVPMDVSVLTAAQRTFVGMSKFSLTAIPFFILGSLIACPVFLDISVFVPELGWLKWMFLPWYYLMW